MPDTIAQNLPASGDPLGCMSGQCVLPPSAFTRVHDLITWAAHGPAWHSVVLVLGTAAAGLAGWRLGRSAWRTIKSQMDKAVERRKELPEDKRADPFTVLVAGLSTTLSYEGMLRVFLTHMHMELWASVAGGGVLELTGFALAREARKKILAEEAADTLKHLVWALSVLSGGISACAATSWLEAVVRFVLPPISAVLWHFTMLPKPDKIKLSQHEQNKKLNRFLLALQRHARSGWATSWYFRRQKERSTDRIAREAILMSSDNSAVLDVAKAAGVAVIMKGLGHQSEITGGPAEGLKELANASGVSLNSVSASSSAPVAPSAPALAAPTGAALLPAESEHSAPTLGWSGPQRSAPVAANHSAPVGGAPAPVESERSAPVADGVLRSLPLRPPAEHSESAERSAPRLSVVQPEGSAPLRLEDSAPEYDAVTADAGDRAIARMSDDELALLWEVRDRHHGKPSQGQIKDALGVGAGKAKNLQHALLRRSDRSGQHSGNAPAAPLQGETTGAERSAVPGGERSAERSGSNPSAPVPTTGAEHSTNPFGAPAPNADPRAERSGVRVLSERSIGGDQVA